MTDEGGPLRGGTEASGGIPDFDRVAVAALAGRVELLSIALVKVAFDDGASSSFFPDDAPVERHLEVGASVEWELDTESFLFSCLVHASLNAELNPTANGLPAENDPNAWIEGTYRAVYAISPGEAATSEQANQFAHWNVVFNVWPFWRELAAGLLQRSRHTPYLIPLFRMPR